MDHRELEADSRSRLTRGASPGRGHRVAAGLLAGLLVVCALASGCQRKPRLAPPGGDSTAVLLDSLAMRQRAVQRRWESDEADDSLAAETAGMLREALARRAAGDWGPGAQRLLDSLGIGAEVAPAGCALVVNLFSRADPGSGSWPFLYWCAAGGVRHQAIEGKGLRLAQLTARGLREGGVAAAAAAAPPGVAALFQRRAAGGLQPMLIVWTPADTLLDRWRMSQTLGPDSLGGIGTGEFVAADTTIELTLRTYETSAYFDECPTCPHAYRVHRFAWGHAGFTRGAGDYVSSPYTTFVQFIQALATGDSPRADALVTDPMLTDQARVMGWAQRTGKWRIAPGVEDSPERMVFYRGGNEAFVVRFAPRGDEWLIGGIEKTERAIE